MILICEKQIPKVSNLVFEINPENWLMNKENLTIKNKYSDVVLSVRMCYTKGK